MTNTIKAILIHLSLSIFLFVVLNHYGIFSTYPTQQNLLNWDANWYYSIMMKGYSFVPNDKCNLAFFPLFPYFWKAVGITPMGISIINMIIFLISFHFLVQKENLALLSQLVLLSIPSLIFMGVPYSEALFFAFSVTLLKGYNDNNTVLKLASFFFLSMIRSVSLLFVPAIVITEVLTGNSQEGLATRLKKIATSFLACFAGVVLSSTIQFIQTGKWLYFVKVQQYWSRHWQIPHFPLTTHMPHRVLAFDGIAFVLGTLALFCLVWWCYATLIKEKPTTTGQNKIQPGLLFSCLYLVGTTLLDTLFTYRYEGSTSIWSLNRHLLCTPFALVFIIYLIKDFNAKKYSFIFYGLIPLVGIAATGLYQYVIGVYYAAFFTVLVVLRFHPHMRYVSLMFYVACVYVQLRLYHDFLLFRWIG